MGLLTALYVYLVHVPKMFLMNFFIRIINLFPQKSDSSIYGLRAEKDDDFFSNNFKKEDKDHWKNWLGSNRMLRAQLRTAKIQVSVGSNSVRVFQVRDFWRVCVGS